MFFFLPINIKVVGICWHFNICERENSIPGLSEPKKAEFLDIFYTYEHLKFHAQLS